MKTLREELAEYCYSLIDADIEAAEKEPVVPSKRFEKKMLALVRTGKKNTSARIKRIVVIAAAALIALALAACAVPKVRGSIAGFFIKVFGDHAEYVDPAVTKERIEEEYGLVPIPEGFEIVETNNNGCCSITTYVDKNETVIQLVQAAKGFSGESVDNEHGDFIEYNLGEAVVRIMHSDLGAQASWVHDGYYFSLTYTNPIELEDFETLIGSVQAK